MTSNIIKKFLFITKQHIHTLEKIIFNNRIPILFSFFFSCLYVLPILLSNVYYRDDLRRSISGFGWKDDGRHLSTFIMSKLTGGGFITDYFPYSQIFAATIVAISGYILCLVIGLEKNKKIKLSSLILLINPFFLENLSYRWDSIPMSISILAVILPFLFISSNWRFLLTSIIGILITMFTYQASIVIYLLMTLIVLINRCLEGDQKLFKYIIWTATSFILGIVIYKFVLIATHIDLTERGSFIFFKENILIAFENNVSSAFVLIRSIFNRYFLALVTSTLLLALFGYIRFFRSNKTFICKVSTIICSIYIILFIPCLIIVLDNTWIGARILVAFPFFIYLLFLFINIFSKKIIPYISILFILLSFGLVSAYANALKTQYALETNLSKAIAEKVDLKNKYLAFIGEVAYAPEVNGTVEKYPILKYLLPIYLGDNVWDLVYLAKATDFKQYPLVLDHQDPEHIKKIRNSIPIIEENFYYVLRADSTQVIVDFNSSVSKKINIETP